MKTMIIYFSWSNNTKNLVERINSEFHYPVYRIEREKPYSTDYNYLAYTEAKEEVDKKIHPVIKKLPDDIKSYDRILLFFPIWWYTFPMPIAAFIDKMKGYQGEIVVFANSYTNDSQYMRNSMRDLKALNGDIHFEEGLFNQSPKRHIEFIQDLSK